MRFQERPSLNQKLDLMYTVLKEPIFVLLLAIWLNQIGTVGHLSVLRRLSSDGVGIERALTLPKLATLVTHEPVIDWRLALSKEGRTRFTRRTRPEVLEALDPYRLGPEYIFRRMPSVETQHVKNHSDWLKACV